MKNATQQPPVVHVRWKGFAIIRKGGVMSSLACLAALRKTVRSCGRFLPERGWGMASRGERRARTLGPILAGACLSLFAWQNSLGAGIERVPVESNDLGISSVEIDHRLHNGDRLLVIRGLDENGEEIAIASLRTGRVLYTAEPGLMPDEWSSLGTELHLSVGEERGFSLVTPDRVPHEVIEPPQASLASFIRLRAVAAVLAEKAGIRVVQPNEKNKKNAGPRLCSGSRFPPSGGDPQQCCQDGEFTWHIVGGGANLGKVAHRSYGRACRQSDGVSKNCGVGSNPFVACAYGPCGAKSEWLAGSNPSRVFVPSSQPNVCGWDTNGEPVAVEGGASYYPEPYTSQALYPGVTAMCPYNLCLVDGTPAVTGFALTVTGAEEGATGDVKSKPSGISIAGAGVDTWGYEGETEVTLKADPVGKRARAVFSGACSESGSYGKKATCTMTMNATSSVTVTYQCEAGFTCEQ